MQEVETEVRKWVKEEKIQIETEREGFIRGRLGIPSGLESNRPSTLSNFQFRTKRRKGPYRRLDKSI